MIKSVIMFSIIFIGCATYQTKYNGSWIIIQDQSKYYENDTLNISIELPYNDYKYAVDYGRVKSDKLSKDILSLVHADKNSDTILYVDRETFIILKDRRDIDFSQYSVFYLEDNTTARFNVHGRSVNLFYRKTEINKRKKMYAINDIFPLGNRVIQFISYSQSEKAGGRTIMDVTNPDDVLFFAGNYRRILDLSKKNAENISINKRTILKPAFDMFKDYFEYGELNNYNAYKLGEGRSLNYVDEDNIRDGGAYYQALATYSAFAGETVKADSVWNIMRGSRPTVRFEKKKSLQELLNTVKDKQVVMFNEAHNVPKHRYLVGTLLDDLYASGFRYLALEAFHNDSLFQVLSYPTSDNGFYINDPIFSNLVRKAAVTGYKIVGYDYFGKDREKRQAMNIYKNTIDKDSSAKVLVLAGYSHINDDKMAGEFKKISGISPFTINQTYCYLKTLGNNTIYSDIAYQIDDSDLENKPKVDVLLYNDIHISSNCFDSSEYSVVSLESVDNATICCIYNKEELSKSEENGHKPIPVAVCNLMNKSKFNVNLCPGDYVALYCNDYGSVIFRETLNLRN